MKPSPMLMPLHNKTDEREEKARSSHRHRPKSVMQTPVRHWVPRLQMALRPPAGTQTNPSHQLPCVQNASPVLSLDPHVSWQLSASSQTRRPGQGFATRVRPQLPISSQYALVSVAPIHDGAGPHAVFG